VYTSMYSMRGYAQYARVCTLCAGMYSMYEFVQYALVCTVCASTYSMRKYVKYASMHSMCEYVQYVEWFSKKIGKRYRLLSEAGW
jgi:formylglycine-generating enzyme required for sulfatase activity